jgi:nucleotide-binding universal stress UspA family protein
MFNKIIAPLDGSPVAEQSLPYVRALAIGLKAPVELLRAYSLPEADWSEITGDEFTFAPVDEKAARSSGHAYLDQLADRERTKAEDYLAFVAKGLQGAAPVTTTVREGRADEVIVNAARERLSTLIVMATHGRSGPVRIALGSVAEKVLLTSPNPLLLVRARKDHDAAREAEVKNIVVPLDGSATAEEILPFAAASARLLNAAVTVTWVVQPLYDYEGYATGLYDAADKEMREMAAGYLEKVCGRLRSAGVSKAEGALLSGTPAAKIVELAENTPGSLIAMTTHGRSGFGRFILGSVADRVVHNAPCPVLLIRSQQQ